MNFLQKAYFNPNKKINDIYHMTKMVHHRNRDRVRPPQETMLVISGPFELWAVWQLKKRLHYKTVPWERTGWLTVGYELLQVMIVMKVGYISRPST